MKKILTIILAILLCAGIGGFAYTLTKDKNPNTNIEQPNDNNSSSTGDNDKLPTISIELMRDTECIYIGCNGGAYLVAVTDTAE